MAQGNPQSWGFASISVDGKLTRTYQVGDTVIDGMQLLTWPTNAS